MARGSLVRDGVDGFGVPIRDMNAIVEKLEYLREHPEERLRMGQNARERAKIFTCDQYRDKAIFLLARCVRMACINESPVSG